MAIRPAASSYDNSVTAPDARTSHQLRRGGFSIGHRDNPTPDLAHRRFALSINLNQGAFEGGELVFREYGEQRYQVPSGAALVFSSSALR